MPDKEVLVCIVFSDSSKHVLHMSLEELNENIKDVDNGKGVMINKTYLNDGGSTCVKRTFFPNHTIAAITWEETRD